MGLPRSKFTTKLITFALVAYASAALISIWAQSEDARENLHSIREEVAEIEVANAELEYAIENRNDPDVIADIARSSLGLVLPGEIILYDSTPPLSSAD